MALFFKNGKELTEIEYKVINSGQCGHFKVLKKITSTIFYNLVVLSKSKISIDFCIKID
jgi:hypothetical protein